MKKILLLCLLWVASSMADAQDKRILNFSTAGFYEMPRTGRNVRSMNVGWRFLLGDAEASEVSFDDSSWNIVSVPHGLEITSVMASGCSNYQGVAWYRKHFNIDSTLAQKRNIIYFEAIMGKCTVWINGKPAGEHFGGFLPVIIDATDFLYYDKENVIAVRADNSDDPLYPPGKPQNVLDFNYSGGIYRDVWLISHHKNIFITDANAEQQQAGGGLFVWCDEVSSDRARVNMRLHTRNLSSTNFKGKVIYRLCDTASKVVATAENSLNIGKNSAIHTENKMIVSAPELHLWSPESPSLYWLEVTLVDQKGNVVDGYKTRVGVRSIEFRALSGLYLNGKPYGKPLIGANRHQDFAVIGNALPNSLHWRDAKKLRDAGLEVIRNAHYPQDPAFMDACDELGLFVIVNTPGWQFWNKTPIFEQRVYQDIRNMVRRDRNRASVLMWEPILNETHYPEYFAQRVYEITNQEYPYGCYTASDEEAQGSKVFPINFSHPKDKAEQYDVEKSYFTREWGDNVDDWNSHNSPSRVLRSWGEQPMLVQARHYAHPHYPYTSFRALYAAYPLVLGGTLWHSFDHQRGYHPDPFYGGIMDAFRLPKYAYYMFMAQRDNRVNNNLIAQTGPMVYIAHEMTPFSGKDVEVYSNCDQVELTYCKDGQTYRYERGDRKTGEMPSPIIRFEGVYDFMDAKALSRQGKQADVWMEAKGFIDGKVVAVHRVAPARRPSKLMLWVDDEQTQMLADGSDMVTVVAAMTDRDGNVKRLSDHVVRFEIEGQGTLVASSESRTNPVSLKWGEAPVLVRSTTKAGTIKIKASVLFEGEQMPLSGEIEIKTVAPIVQQLFTESPSIMEFRENKINGSADDSTLEIEALKKELNTLKLKEVERQQEHFGEKEKDSLKNK